MLHGIDRSVGVGGRRKSSRSGWRPAAASQPANVAEAARAAAKSGELCFRLTTPAELKALLGPPAKAHEENNGNGKALILEYPGVRAIFGRFGEGAPYSLFRVSC